MTSANQLTLLRILSVPGFSGAGRFRRRRNRPVGFPSGRDDGFVGRADRPEIRPADLLGAGAGSLADKLLMIGALVVLALENPALEVQIPNGLTLSW